MTMSELDTLRDDVKGRNGDKRRNTVIAVGTVVLVILAYLTWRHLANTAAGGGSADGINPTSDGVTGGTDSGDQTGTAILGGINTENAYLATLLAQITTVTGKLTKLNKQEQTQEETLRKIKAKLPPRRHKKPKHKGKPVHFITGGAWGSINNPLSNEPHPKHKPAHPAQHSTHKPKTPKHPATNTRH